MLKYVGITAAIFSYFTGSSDKGSVVLTLQENQVKKRKFLLVLVATNLSVCYDNPNTTGKTSNGMSSRLCNALTVRCLLMIFFSPDDQYEQTITVTVGTLPSGEHMHAPSHCEYMY